MEWNISRVEIPTSKSLFQDALTTIVSCPILCSVASPFRNRLSCSLGSFSHYLVGKDSTAAGSHQATRDNGRHVGIQPRGTLRAAEAFEHFSQDQLHPRSVISFMKTSAVS